MLFSPRPPTALLVWTICSVAGCSGSEPTKPATDDTSPTGTTEDTPTETGDTGQGPTNPGPRFDCYSDVTVDEGDDGIADGSGFDGYDPVYHTNLLYLERDYNGNGSPEQFASWVRDPEGRVTHYEAWGTTTGGYDATYDPDGNRLTYDEDSDGDRLYDFSYRYAYTDSALVHLERDDGADGSVDYILDYVRDGEGHRLSAEEDEDGDGQTDVWYTYILDEVGREVEIDIDEGNDGIFETVITTSYTDPLLEIGASSLDVDFDGEIDQVTAFEYDESRRELYYGIDVAPVDGVFDYERWSERDALGKITHYRLRSALYGNVLELVQDLVYDSLGRTIYTHSILTDLTAEQTLSNTSYTYDFGGTCGS